MPISQIHNINEVEEGSRRVELTECVWSGDKEDNLRNMSRLILIAESESRLFSMKLVTTREFAIVIEVIRLSCDGLVIFA